MDYYAHAWLAAAWSDDPHFALGAMLPDWIPWVGDRLVRAAPPALTAGIRFHHATDAAFHASPGFTALVRAATAQLRAAGLARGPARGAAHVGIELLLGDALMEDPSKHAPYLAALGVAPAAAPGLVWSRARSGQRFDQVLERLRSQGRPQASGDPEQLARRIVRTLARRPRLRVDPTTQPTLTAWVREARPAVRKAAPDLVTETMAGLQFPKNARSDSRSAVCPAHPVKLRG